MMINRKADIGLGVIVVIVIALFFLGWLINLNQRECKSNKDCGSEAYCGSDFACHSYPTIQKKVVQYNLILPSIIIGIAIVIASLIFRWNKTKQESSKGIVEIREEIASIPKASEVEETKEPYYKSNTNVRSP